jgi:TRAP-type mannitol/chloroaromatic compound transport system permease small subunit
MMVNDHDATGAVEPTPVASRPADTARERWWLRGVDALSLWLAVAGGLCLILMTATTVGNVISRWFLGAPLPGTLDLTTFVWMPAVALLPMGYALQRAEHIRVSLLTTGASSRAQRITEIGGLLLTALMLAVLVYLMFELAMQNAAVGETAPGTPWLSIWPMRGVAAFALLVFLLQTLAELFRSIAPTPRGAEENGTAS